MRISEGIMAWVSGGGWKRPRVAYSSESKNPAPTETSDCIPWPLQHVLDTETALYCFLLSQYSLCWRLRTPQARFPRILKKQKDLAKAGTQLHTWPPSCQQFSTGRRGNSVLRCMLIIYTDLVGSLRLSGESYSKKICFVVQGL